MNKHLITVNRGPGLARLTANMPLIPGVLALLGFMLATAWTQFVFAEDFPARQAAAEGQEQVHKIMLMAHKGKAKGLKKWTATADYLSARIPGHRFDLVPLDWDGMRAYIQTGEADFVLSNPGMYVEFEAGYGIRRLATLKNLRL